MDERFISKGGRLISDILRIKGLLLMVHIEKAFDSAGHQLLINVFKTFGFQENLVRWIKILLKKSVVMYN